MGPQVKTLYNKQIEESDGIKQQVQEIEQNPSVDMYLTNTPAPLTELFTFMGITVKQYHLQMIQILLQVLLLMAFVKYYKK